MYLRTVLGRFCVGPAIGKSGKFAVEPCREYVLGRPFLGLMWIPGKSIENLWKRGSGENLSKISRKSMETRLWRKPIENLSKIYGNEVLANIYRKSIESPSKI